MHRRTTDDMLLRMIGCFAKASIEGDIGRVQRMNNAVSAFKRRDEWFADSGLDGRVFSDRDY